MEKTTVHRLINGDARDLSFLDDDSVHLVVTSPPYWNLKRYNENPDQLGHIQDSSLSWRKFGDTSTVSLSRVAVLYVLLVMSALQEGILGDTWFFLFIPTLALYVGESASTTLTRSSGTKSPTLHMKLKTAQNSLGSHTNRMPSSRTILSLF